MTLQEVKLKVERLGETTAYDINQIELNTIQFIYEKYNLPPLFVEDGFHQGKATDEEIQNTIKEINEMYPKMTVIESADKLFEFLDDEFMEEYEKQTVKVIKENWIEYYKEDIKDFLKERYFWSGEQIGLDWSVFIDIETGEVWEHTEASSNWGFIDHDPNRKLVVHINNYGKPFLDHTDLIASESKEIISDNLCEDIPDYWEDMDYYEQLEWVENNVQSGVEGYNDAMRDEAIEVIIHSIKDVEERDYFED